MSYLVATTAVLLFCAVQFSEGVKLVHQEIRGGRILSVTIDGCDQDDCQLVLNATYTVTTTFNAKYAINGGSFLIRTHNSVSWLPLVQVPVCHTVKPACEYSITTQLTLSKNLPAWYAEVTYCGVFQLKKHIPRRAKECINSIEFKANNITSCNNIVQIMSVTEKADDQFNLLTSFDVAPTLTDPRSLHLYWTWHSIAAAGKLFQQAKIFYYSAADLNVSGERQILDPVIQRYSLHDLQPDTEYLICLRVTRHRQNRPNQLVSPPISTPSTIRHPTIQPPPHFLPSFRRPPGSLIPIVNTKDVPERIQLGHDLETYVAEMECRVAHTKLLHWSALISSLVGIVLAICLSIVIFMVLRHRRKRRKSGDLDLTHVDASSGRRNSGSKLQDPTRRSSRQQACHVHPPNSDSSSGRQRVTSVTHDQIMRAPSVIHPNRVYRQDRGDTSSADLLSVDATGSDSYYMISSNSSATETMIDEVGSGTNRQSSEGDGRELKCSHKRTVSFLVSEKRRSMAAERQASISVTSSIGRQPGRHSLKRSPMQDTHRPIGRAHITVEPRSPEKVSDIVLRTETGERLNKDPFPVNSYTAILIPPLIDDRDSISNGSTPSVRPGPPSPNVGDLETSTTSSSVVVVIVPEGNHRVVDKLQSISSPHMTGSPPVITTSNHHSISDQADSNRSLLFKQGELVSDKLLSQNTTSQCDGGTGIKVGTSVRVSSPHCGACEPDGDVVESHVNRNDGSIFFTQLVETL